MTAPLVGGCGYLGAVKGAFADPSSLAAANDAASLQIVVHRADTARSLSTEVDRLLTRTPTGDDATWPAQTHLSDETVTRLRKEYASHPYYAEGSETKVVPALVWARGLSEIKSESGATPSLLAALSPEIGDGYTALHARFAELASVRAQRAEEEAAADRPNISDADKKAHRANADALGAKIDKLKDAIEPAQKAFIASCKTAATKIAPAARDRYGVAIVNLREAVHSAQTANAAAAIRYPLVAADTLRSPSNLEKVLLDVAKANASDIIFEQTGKRLDVKKLGNDSFGLKLQGTKVSVTVSGLSPEDLGSIQVDQLITQTAVRTEAFFASAASAAGTIAASADLLEFQHDVLDAIESGMKDGGWKAVAAADVRTMPEGAPPPSAKASGKGGHLRLGN